MDAHRDLVFAGDYRFEYGRAVRVRQGGMGTIFALGSMTQKALTAAGLLAGRGIDVSVWSVSCPLEVDRAALEEACASGYVLSVEDHQYDSPLLTPPSPLQNDFHFILYNWKFNINK